MGENVLVKLLKAYAEEGYTVRVGLNPWRENPGGPFASLILSDSLNQLEKLPDSHYAAKSLPLPYISEYEGREFAFLFKAIKAVLKKNHFLLELYKIIAIRDSKKSKGGREEEVQYLSTGGGIAIDEIYFFENVLKQLQPKKGFLIGIAAGWSTIALGLINPSISLYGIDNLTEGGQAKEGLDLTRKIAKKLNIDLKIHIGSSPQDVPQFLGELVERIDFLFIDGLHTNEQVFLDFEVSLPYLSKSCVVAFHDVLDWNMLEGWQKIAELGAKNDFKHRLLRRTSSGMGVLYRNVNKDVEESIEAFYQT
ncbi:class I SAM-dependent methyltransferase [Argonema antarcticum]|uniref:class I SAM-dependent methyltransferase n=1 Tax=Argonema antarcticum TaxID=2942763 RepID=UPI002013ADF2|nr:class I SAM-dependent methyltransferase [Argonema antarcticum]MCL1470561.1 class I SAM-dependent methyltransferase [Argonema antarcticum A004/B2]